MSELFRKKPERARDRLTLRCLAKLHATRHIALREMSRYSE
jgi:hypothetical protein